MRSFDDDERGLQALAQEVVQHPTHAYLIQCADEDVEPVLTALRPALLGVPGARADHPDWRVVGQERRVARADVEAWPEGALVPPIAAAFKVLVVLGADRMTDEAQNLLLKVVEEPPASARTLLVAAEALGVATTLKSRCRQIRVLSAASPQAPSPAAREVLAGRLSSDTGTTVLAEAARLIRDELREPGSVASCQGWPRSALVPRWEALEEAARALDANLNRELVAWRLGRAFRSQRGAP